MAYVDKAYFSQIKLTNTSENDKIYLNQQKFLQGGSKQGGKTQAIKDKMALIMPKETHLLIFKALFAEGSKEYGMVKQLMGVGVSFSCGLYKIIAITDEAKKTNNFPEVVLPVGTSTLIKNTPVATNVLDTCRDIVKAWLMTLYVEHFSKSLMDVPTYESPSFYISDIPLIDNSEETKKEVEFKDISKVIPLKDASVIGQKVNGTSKGSVYHCIAFNPRVKMAVRMTKEAVSFRVEAINPTTKEIANLDNLGMPNKGGYRSMHLQTDGVPVGKVIGAVLFGCGVRFDQVVTNIEDIPVGK